VPTQRKGEATLPTAGNTANPAVAIMNPMNKLARMRLVQPPLIEELAEGETTT